MTEDKKCNYKECPYRLLWDLLKALPSGKGKISWHDGIIKHYEDIETEVKKDLKE